MSDSGNRRGGAKPKRRINISHVKEVENGGLRSACETRCPWVRSGIVFRKWRKNHGHRSSRKPLGNCSCGGYHAALPRCCLRLERFVKPLTSSGHWTLYAGFTHLHPLIVCLGAGTVLGGLWQDRVGPRRVATVAGIFTALAYMLAALGAANIRLSGSTGAMALSLALAWEWDISVRLLHW